MLSLRDDVFPDYTEEAFVREFGRLFRIVQSIRIADTVRTLYFLERL
jgi:hypothetical protein